MTLTATPADFSLYEGKFYNKVYRQNPGIVHAVCLFVLFGGIFLAGPSVAHLAVQGVTRGAISCLGVAVVFVPLSFACLKEIKKGNQSLCGKPLGAFFVTACSKKGKGHPINQDKFLATRLYDGNVLVGVFDGHGRDGHVVAEVARKYFRKLFEHYLSHDVEWAFRKTVHKLQEMVKKLKGGTCFSVAHIDRRTKAVTVATLGDCAIMLYRVAGSKIVAEKISKVTSWNDPEEEHRLAAINSHRHPNERYQIMTIDGEPKKRIGVWRSKGGRHHASGNFTGSIGDRLVNKGRLQWVLHRAPLFTHTQLQGGDLLGAFTDGITDGDELRVSGLKEKWGKRVNMADHFAHTAWRELQNSDDCTAAVLHVPTHHCFNLL